MTSLISFRVAPSSGSVNLFGAQRIGLFNKASDVPDVLETWSKLEQRELKLAVTHPPNNYFGKLFDCFQNQFEFISIFRENDSLD